MSAYEGISGAILDKVINFVGQLLTKKKAAEADPLGADAPKGQTAADDAKGGPKLVTAKTMVTSKKDEIEIVDKSSP